MMSVSVIESATENKPEVKEEEWPTIIAQLRQQLYQMPGLASARKQLAVAYNNYGVSLADHGDYDDGIRQLEQATQVDPSNAQFQTNLVTIYLQLAQHAYQTHQVQTAKDAIDQVLALDPSTAQAYALLGEIEYQSQHLKEAKAAWQKALASDPQIEGVKEKLAQVSHELPVESGFERLSQAYFDIRYTGGLERSAGFDIRDELLEARRAVGGDFSCRLKGKLVVLVYTAEQFCQLRQDTPDWVAGQYDGKIRVPLPSRELDRNAVARILFHEYTHAVIHEPTQNRCPVWMNEGLAEYEGWKHAHAPWVLLRNAVASHHVIAWSELSAQFSTASTAQEVALAYEESHSIVAYLIERYGMWRIRRVLGAVAQQTPVEEALPAEVHLKLARLEANWRKWL